MTTALWVLVGIVVFYAAVLFVGYRAASGGKVRVIVPPAHPRYRHLRAIDEVGDEADRVWKEGS